MQYVPHDYQVYATKRIIDQAVCGLFLEPGLGKTVITLSAIWDLMLDAFEVSKVLVIAPLRVAQNTWDEELNKWDHLSGLSISKVLGTEAERLAALRKKASIYIINRENVEWLTEAVCWNFDMLVIDELSSFKSHAAKRFKALRKKIPMIRRRVGLTGTPSPNSLMDLWSEVYLLDQGNSLGQTIGYYRSEYFVPEKMNGMTVYSYRPRKNAEAIIYRRLQDLCISMKTQDFLKIPDRIDRFVKLALPDPARAMYKRLESDLLLPFADGDVDAMNAAVLSGKLLQMANGAVYDEFSLVKEIHSVKLDALEDLIEAAGGKPVLVYFSYRHDRDRILTRFPAKELSTPEDFKAWNRGEIPIAIAHPASMGHGLNLQQGGSTVIWFGLPWSLELYIQANARLWRQGQKNTVVVFHLIAEGTIDETVMSALSRKDLSQQALMNAVKARIGGAAHD